VIAGKGTEDDWPRLPPDSEKAVSPFGCFEISFATPTGWLVFVVLGVGGVWVQGGHVGCLRGLGLSAPGFTPSRPSAQRRYRPAPPHGARHLLTLTHNHMTQRSLCRVRGRGRDAKGTRCTGWTLGGSTCGASRLWYGTGAHLSAFPPGAGRRTRRLSEASSSRSTRPSHFSPTPTAHRRPCRPGGGVRGAAHLGAAHGHRAGQGTGRLRDRPDDSRSRRRAGQVGPWTAANRDGMAGPGGPRRLLRVHGTARRRGRGLGDARRPAR
jgi:hypothetical protein